MKQIKNRLSIQKLILICISISLISGLSSFAQTEQICIGEMVNLHSKILDEDRILLVSLPDNYELSNRSYPVLYLLDGNTHFKHANAAADFLSDYGFAPELIVVAITNIDRNRDFTPIISDNNRTGGGALKFHNFITDEVFPYIEDNYRSADYRILMGHSLGGVFIGYSLLEHPAVFDSYIAVSPYLQYANNYIVNESQSKLRKEYDKPISLYMTIGNEPDYFQSLDKFSDLIQNKSGKSIDFLYVEMKDDNHSTTPYLSLFNGLRFTFSDWGLPQSLYDSGLAAMDNHFAKLSKKYNYEITVSENTINAMGYNFLTNNEIDKAISIFTENTKRFPNSANVYDSLGEAYENNQQLEQALINYQKACDLGKEQNLGTLSIFTENLKRVKDQLNK